MKLRAFFLLAVTAAAQQPAIEQFGDPVTGRRITRYVSGRHENHHYYDISPWDPEGKRILFFRMDDSVSKLTATGKYPGSLWIRNVDGTGERKISGTVEGNYHTGVNQFWGPNGATVYHSRSNMVDLATGRETVINTPVAANRTSPDFKTISCVRNSEWGLYDIATNRYEQLVTLERAVALTPRRDLLGHKPSALQNTRFNPKGAQIIIVHRTTEDFPSLVEMFLYDIPSRQLKHLAADLHHPSWRPDGKGVMFVRRLQPDSTQALIEVDTRTGEERRLTKEHVSAGHPSYHPTKPHWIVTDCYGGDMGNGLALIDTRTGKQTQLVTIPLGSRPEPAADGRFPFRNWGLWIPQRKYLNEPRPVWNADGSRILFTSEESGRMNIYTVDTSDLQ